jgi:tetratricopeptide (TPR) repeat protein
VAGDADRLRRLLVLNDAYRLAGDADELSAIGRHDAAAALYRRASELAPGNHELLFWAGLGAAQVGELDAALRDVRAAIALRPSWRELLARIPPKLAPAARQVLAALDA